MPEPMVYDARHGLSQAALDDLARAVRLDLTAKTATTTVVGYWVPDDGEQLRALVLEGNTEQVGDRDLVLTVPVPRHWAWPEQVGRLQVGDVLRAKWVPGGVVLEVERAAETFVLVSVHSGSSGPEASPRRPTPPP